MRGGRLLREAATSGHSEAPKVTSGGFARRSKARGEGLVAARRRGPASKEAGVCRRGRTRGGSPPWGGLTRRRGSIRSPGSFAAVSGPRRVFGPRGSGGFEGPRLGQGLWRGRNTRSAAAVRLGFARVDGTDSQGEQGFEAGDAGGTVELRPCAQGGREASFGSWKGSPIGGGGSRRLRSRAWESVKPTLIRPRWRVVPNVGR